jgi:dTDP-3-amino-2,3,6-trideoxy-4-keto-D-glucose/dTDP-3-amino-3,4,6-trideoxy-alpha-D-glucose/dTDP-2,6-dideoxy-D-kanosamine transaminase
MTTIDDLGPVPFNDLGRGTAALRPQIDAAISRVLSSGWFVMGPEHDSFETEIGQYLGGSRAVLVGNGTDALELALIALGVQPGDTVLTAANAGGYAATAARSIGATPAFVDVEPDTHLLSVRTVNAALDELDHTPAVLVVTHLYGAMADIVALVDRAHERGMSVIEDCAQALGAIRDGKRAGTVGDIGTTSFYPTKNLGALGDGGAIFTNVASIDVELRKLRQYGWESKYRASSGRGRNSRLDELQAAILRVKLPMLDSQNERRRAIHSSYEQAAGAGVRLVNTATGAFTAHLAVAVVAERDRVKAAFEAAGIRTDIHYPVADHLQPIAHSPASTSLPVTEKLASEILSLPLFPELTDREIERVQRAIESVSS